MENGLRKRFPVFIFYFLSVGYLKIEKNVIFTVLGPILASRPQNSVPLSPQTAIFRWPAPPLQYTKIEVRVSQGQLHSPKDPPSVYHTRGLNRAGGLLKPGNPERTKPAQNSEDVRFQICAGVLRLLKPLRPNPHKTAGV